MEQYRVVRCVTYPRNNNHGWDVVIRSRKQTGEYWWRPIYHEQTRREARERMAKEKEA